MKHTQANAVDLLKQVVQQRNWHKSTLTTQVANKHKKAAINGTIKYSTAKKLLEQLGYRLVQDEVWEAPY